MRWSVLLPTLLLSCSGDSGAAAHRPNAAHVPQVLAHDFGVIPHGEKRSHEFVLDLSPFGEEWVPLRAALDCSCGRADLRLRRADGTERFVDNSGSASSRPARDERLVLHLEIDTATKEAIDLAHTESRGYVMLQSLADPNTIERVQWPLRVGFGVDSPVDLRPLAALDFGNVPVSAPGHIATTVRGDEAHAAATFGPATCSDPAVAVDLVREGDHWLLRATCTGTELGSYRASITVQNSIPGYRLELPVMWKVVPDLQATPMAKISFRANLAVAQTDAEAIGQFVLLADHDPRRSPEFSVLRCVDEAGSDLSSHFAIRFEPMAQSPRQCRMVVRYVGGLDKGVRGSIVLTKNGAVGPFLPIELVVFAS